MNRIQKYNASASHIPLWKWKIQVKRAGRWSDYRTNGVVKVFDNEFHAENYRKLIK